MMHNTQRTMVFLRLVVVDLLTLGGVHGLTFPNGGLSGSTLQGIRFVHAAPPCEFWSKSSKLTSTNLFSSNADDDKPLENEGTKRDPEVPKTWSAETFPMEVVRYYAREGVTNEQIQTLLQQYTITSLDKLYDRLWIVSSIIQGDDGCYRELSDNIISALKKTEMQAVKLLGGTLVPDLSCLSDVQLDLYTEKAVCFHCRGERTNVRYPSYTLVMGPSGSGKTMFALKYLPRLALVDAKSDDQIFTIHVAAKKLLGDHVKPDKNLPALLVDHVQTMIAAKLNATFGTAIPPPIDLFLFVLIDEAGRPDYKTFFDEGSKIEDLVTALTLMGGYTFLKAVHVAVAGTALETSTMNIDSKLDAMKFHMRPWSQANFHALLGMLKRPDEEHVKQIVERFHILSSLTTNARCAYFLAVSLPNITIANEARWAGYVDLTVPKVADCYIGTNGLQKLASPQEKFIVAQGAFKAIDEATRQPTAPHLPSFDHMPSIQLRSCTQSLLDITVDIVDGETVLTAGSKYSVSMTPAITVVLAELLCAKAQVCWDWRDFENAAGLGEWKKMVTDMKPCDYTDASGIIQLRSAVPGTRAQTVFSLPVVGRSIVLLNRPRAPYADIMAPFRLLQAKFSVDTDKVLQLNFLAEMRKMGLTVDNEGHQLQQATTSVLYLMWQEKLKADDGSVISKIDKFPKLSYRLDVRCEHYPCQTLLSGDIRVDVSVKFVVDVAKGIVVPDTKEGSTKLNEQPTEIKILEEFTVDQPVTAVFVTNQRSIVIQTHVPRHQEKENGDNVVPDGGKSESSDENNGKSSGSEQGDSETLTFTIGRDDVDWQGVLKKPLPEYLVQNLRRNVDVRFLLY